MPGFSTAVFYLFTCAGTVLRHVSKTDLYELALNEGALIVTVPCALQSTNRSTIRRF
jgi:hypothetical protein